MSNDCKNNYFDSQSEYGSQQAVFYNHWTRLLDWTMQD